MDRKLIIGGVVVMAFGALLFGVLYSDGEAGTGGPPTNSLGDAGPFTGSGVGDTPGIDSPLVGTDAADGGVPRVGVRPPELAEVTPVPRNPGDPVSPVVTPPVSDPVWGLARRADEPFVSNGYELGRTESRRMELERRIVRVRERADELEARGDTLNAERQRLVLTRLEGGVQPLLEREQAYRARAEQDGTSGDRERGFEETNASLVAQQPLSPTVNRRQ